LECPSVDVVTIAAYLCVQVIAKQLGQIIISVLPDELVFFSLTVIIQNKADFIPILKKVFL
jgi:hypothetical protein